MEPEVMEAAVDILEQEVEFNRRDFRSESLRCIADRVVQQAGIKSETLVDAYLERIRKRCK